MFRKLFSLVFCFCKSNFLFLLNNFNVTVVLYLVSVEFQLCMVVVNCLRFLRFNVLYCGTLGSMEEARVSSYQLW